MKIEVNFPADFDKEEVSPIPLGRMYLGSCVVRLIFDKDGSMKMLIPQSAIDAKLVIVWDDGPNGLLGLGDDNASKT